MRVREGEHQNILGRASAADTGNVMSPARAGEGCTAILQNKNQEESSLSSHRISQFDNLSQIILSQKIKKKTYPRSS